MLEKDGIFPAVEVIDMEKLYSQKEAMGKRKGFIFKLSNLYFQGRLIVEIVWPLFLFMILFLVRLRGLKKNHHECE